MKIAPDKSIASRLQRKKGVSCVFSGVDRKGRKRANVRVKSRLTGGVVLGVPLSQTFWYLLELALPSSGVCASEWLLFALLLCVWLGCVVCVLSALFCLCRVWSGLVVFCSCVSVGLRVCLVLSWFG
jgi:hypothetical protein